VSAAARHAHVHGASTRRVRRLLRDHRYRRVLLQRRLHHARHQGAPPLLWPQLPQYNPPNSTQEAKHTVALVADGAAALPPLHPTTKKYNPIPPIPPQTPLRPRVLCRVLCPPQPASSPPNHRHRSARACCAACSAPLSLPPLHPTTDTAPPARAVPRALPPSACLLPCHGRPERSVARPTRLDDGAECCAWSALRRVSRVACVQLTGLSALWTLSCASKPLTDPRLARRPKRRLHGAPLTVWSGGGVVARADRRGVERACRRRPSRRAGPTTRGANAGAAGHRDARDEAAAAAQQGRRRLVLPSSGQSLAKNCDLFDANRNE
jgi:hypothetical protein